MQNQYKTPLHTLSEITSYFTSLKITIPSTYILSPTPLTTLTIFETILQTYSTLTCTDTCSRHLEIFRKIKLFLNKVGVTLTFKDFLYMDSNKLIYVLGVIVNFGMYKEFKLDIYEKTKNEIVHISENLNNLEQKRKILALQKNRSCGDSAETLRVLVEKELRNVEVEIELLRKEEACCEKNEKNEKSVKFEIEKLFEDAERLKLRNEKLKTEIVTDPKKLLFEVAETKKRLDKIKEEICGLEEEHEHITEKVLRIKRVGDNFFKIKTKSMELLEIQARSKNVSEAIKSTSLEIKNKIVFLASQKLKINHLTKQIEKLNLRQNAESELCFEKIKGLENKKALFKEEIEKCVEINRNKESVVCDILEELNLIGADIVKRKEEHENLLMSLKMDVQELKNKISKCFVEFNKKFGI